MQKKTITPDYLTHERKYNHGEEELITIKDHHPPIVSRRLWEEVQSEIQKRTRCVSSPQAHSNHFLFSGKIFCGECGSPFVSRTKKRSDGTSYRRWCCRNAVKYGTEIHNGFGCDVGKLIPDKLAANMLIAAIKSLPMDHAALIRQALSIIPQTPKSPTQKKSRLRKRLDAAIDAYLSDSISKDELEAIKRQCRTDTHIEDTVNRPDDCHLFGEEILSGMRFSEIFLKTLLRSITVYKGGHVELRLKDLSFVWHFELYLDGCH